MELGRRGELGRGSAGGVCCRSGTAASLWGMTIHEAHRSTVAHGIETLAALHHSLSMTERETVFLSDRRRAWEQYVIIEAVSTVDRRKVHYIDTASNALPCSTT